IGPEGDFSTSEFNLAVAKGLLPVSLGPATLRTETAAMVAVAAMNMARGSR
ncbi:MAG: RsmE family RNA methyltransferase, partial [Bacteroidota bacterium]